MRKGKGKKRAMSIALKLSLITATAFLATGSLFVHYHARFLHIIMPVEVARRRNVERVIDEKKKESTRIKKPAV